MRSKYIANNCEYELIDLHTTPPTASLKAAPSRSEPLPKEDDDVYSLTRLSRDGYHDTSRWLVWYHERQTTDDPHGTDIGEFLQKSHFSVDGFQAFLRSSGSIPRPHEKVYNTEGWFELGEEQPDWKLDRKVSWALKTLQKVLGSRQSEYEEESEYTNDFRSWLNSATQIGMKARMTSSTDTPSLFDSPKYRTPQILIDQLANLRDGTHDIRTERAARVISDWLDATVVAGDPERRQHLKDWPEDRRRVVEAFEAWWAV